MRPPRMTRRRWILVVAAGNVLMGMYLTPFPGPRSARAESPRATYQERAEFHARERDNCLKAAEHDERLYRLRKVLADRWCPIECNPTLWVMTCQDYVAALDVRDQARYHIDLEARYRRAPDEPGFIPPIEKPFRSDDRGYSAEQLLDKSERYAALEEARKWFASVSLMDARWARERGESKGSEESTREAEKALGLAEKDASIASECRQRANREHGVRKR